MEWIAASGYSFYLVGGRRELYSSSGYQPSDSRVAKAELVVISGMFLDGRRETRGRLILLRPPAIGVTI